MQLNYRIVFIITFLLVTLSLSMSVINYLVALHATQVQLKERALPLTIDNIYTEIQKHIIEPNLVSSMMAHDTFLKDWLINEEDDIEKITRYLESIKNKYNMFTTFLVSENTKNYYTSKGFIEKISETRPENAWYFDFKKIQNAYEINLDFNEHIDDSMIMFINHKIFDREFHMIGATGIGLRVSYINDMLKRFRKQYNFNVYFLNETGEVVLFEHGVNKLRHIKDVPELYALKDDLITKQSKVLAYSKMGEEYLLNTKYVPELDLYLVVEAKLSHFMEGVVETFYFNLVGSLLITILITLLILMTIRKYHKKLEYLASNDPLTDLPNRRSFDKKFHQFFLLQKRHFTPISLLFFDLDNFKNINDTHGHQCGDKVLKRIAQILKQHIRQTDLAARWGGEEFIVAFIDCDLEEAKLISEKLRKHIDDDEFLHQTNAQRVTASFGLTSLAPEDSIDTLLKRVDGALYEAKSSGKNQIAVR
jgi:diguanylate cyclase (GGDEF)-like protein